MAGGAPQSVKLAPVNISVFMDSISSTVTNRYITLDLSACSASNNTISSSYIHDNQYIVGVILPNSLTSIGQYAFDGCSSLTSVTFAAGSNISSSNFSSSYPFPGDLRAKYLQRAMFLWVKFSASGRGMLFW